MQLAVIRVDLAVAGADRPMPSRALSYANADGDGGVARREFAFLADPAIFRRAGIDRMSACREREREREKEK